MPSRGRSTSHEHCSMRVDRASSRASAVPAEQGRWRGSLRPFHAEFGEGGALLWVQAVASGLVVAEEHAEPDCHWFRLAFRRDRFCVGPGNPIVAFTGDVLG